MPIRQATLLEYAARMPLSKRARNLLEARATNTQTAFLCHSHLDATLAKGVQGLLEAQGWSVYIDWEDATMPEIPDKKTADAIRTRIKELDWFLFLATANSTASRWCPWELGYADGKKKYDSILILPTTDNSGRYYGNEYMQLYRHIWESRSGDFGAYFPDDTGGLLRGMSPP